jgi:hypothetical protein
MTNKTAAGHTPGPWTARYADRIGFIIEVGPKDSMQAGKVADIIVRGGGESHGNALLIAAAPELLEALKAMLADGPAGLESRIMARAALAKAQGGR